MNKQTDKQTQCQPFQKHNLFFAKEVTIMMTIIAKNDHDDNDKNDNNVDYNVDADVHNVNVYMYVYRLIPPWVQQTSQFTLLLLEFSYTVSSPLGRTQCTFCIECHSQFSIFHSTRYPSLLGGQRWNDVRGLPNTSSTWPVLTRVPFTYPSANQAPHCLPL